MILSELVMVKKKKGNLNLISPTDSVVGRILEGREGRWISTLSIPGRKVIDLSMMQRAQCMQSVLRSRLIYLEHGVVYSGQCWLLVASWVRGMFLSRWALVVSISASMKILFMIPFSIFWSGWRRDWLTAIEQVIFYYWELYLTGEWFEWAYLHTGLILRGPSLNPFLRFQVITSKFQVIGQIISQWLRRVLLLIFQWHLDKTV